MLGCTRTAIVVACLAPVPTLAGGQAPDTLTSVRQGVYTEDQAQRGKRIYEHVCSQCHGPEYFNERVLPSWVGAPVSLLFNLLATTMPEDRPARLKPQEYADVLAYIFKLNGLPPGEHELSSRPEALERIMIERRP